MHGKKAIGSWQAFKVPWQLPFHPGVGDRRAAPAIDKNWENLYQVRQWVIGMASFDRDI
jgi:hypothetical protein